MKGQFAYKIRFYYFLNHFKKAASKIYQAIQTLYKTPQAQIHTPSCFVNRLRQSARASQVSWDTSETTSTFCSRGEDIPENIKELVALMEHDELEDPFNYFFF